MPRIPKRIRADIPELVKEAGKAKEAIRLPTGVERPADTPGILCPTARPNAASSPGK